MATEKQRKTFLSYSRANKDFAVRLARELKAEGFWVWLDQLDIPAGSRWDVEVEKALEECEIFMIIMTPAAIASENVRDEMGYAIDNGKRFLPVLLEKCNVPLRLRRFQYVDFTNKSFDDGVESAKDLLRSLIAQTTIPRAEFTGSQVQAEADRIAAQKAEEERLAKDRAETERMAKEEADRIAAQKAEAERLAQEKVEEERLAKAKAEKERKAKDKADRLAMQKAEAERLAQEKVEEERLAKARTEKEHEAKEEADRLAAQKAEAERLAQEKVEEERLAKARAEKEHEAKEEADRLAAQKAEADRSAEQKAEEERVAKARAEAEHKAKERVDHPAPQKAAPAGIKPTAQKKPVSRGLVIGIAAVVVLCVAGIGIGAKALLDLVGSTTEAPTVAPTETPVASAAPTKVQPASTVSVSTPTPNPSKFFTLKFTNDTALDEFEFFGIGDGNENKITTTPSNGALKFVIGDQDLFAYYIHQFVYKDVIVRVRAKNIGTVKNDSISLICRYTGNTWYEFSVASDGAWTLGDVNLVYEEVSGAYINALSGDDFNEYEMRCIGNTITLYINGNKQGSFEVSRTGGGRVGFDLAAFDRSPVEILVDEFVVSEP